MAVDVRRRALGVVRAAGRVMGRRGPPPKPTALRILNGNAAKRPLNDREPRAPTGDPRCPSWLSKEAKQAWRRLVPLLSAMKVLTLADVDALTAYCQTYARWRAAEAFLQQHGEVYPLRDEQGKVRCMQQFPQVSIARNLLLVLKTYQQEFGLTPASRSRLVIAAEDEDDAAARFFGA